MRYAVGNNNVCRFSCPEGFGKTVGSLCVACPSNCVRCDANLKCLSCQYNYVINVATQACVLNYCGDGYFTGSLQCQPCVTGCATCQIDGSCLSCQSGYTLQSTACVDNNCQIKQYYSTNTQQCYSCTSPCLTCTKSATQCTSC